MTKCLPNSIFAATGPVKLVNVGMVSSYIDIAWEHLRGDVPERCCVITDANCVITTVSDAFLDSTGYTRDEVVGQNPRFLQGPDTSPEARAFFRKAIEGQRPAVIEILNYRKSREPFWFRVSLRPIWSLDGELPHYGAIQTPLSEAPVHPTMKFST